VLNQLFTQGGRILWVRVIIRCSEDTDRLLQKQEVHRQANRSHVATLNEVQKDEIKKWLRSIGGIGGQVASWNHLRL